MKLSLLFKMGILILIMIPLLIGFYLHFTKINSAYSVSSKKYSVPELEFLYDLTYEDSNDKVKHEQMIFQQAFDEIDQAEDFIVIDMFLFNDDYDHKHTQFPKLSKKLADKLIAKKAKTNIPIIFITDPINTFYNTYTPTHIKAMQAAGIKVITTDLNTLRTSNPLYSGYYMTYLKWLVPNTGAYLPNVFRPMGPKGNLASYLSLLNFKANHRKVLITEKTGLILSANPHDGSAWHSNIGVSLKGKMLADLLKSEEAVYELSGGDKTVFSEFYQKIESPEIKSSDTYQLQLITESKIKANVLKTINQADAETTIQIGMFYLSDRDVINALRQAAKCGATIKLILDINQDAFGKKKVGIPNKPVANELIKASENIHIRWYKSHGEQYHAKFIYVEDAKQATFIGGSANFTKRNLADYNLETDVMVSASPQTPFMQEIQNYYNRLWENDGGIYTLPYAEAADEALWKTGLYRFQEWSGLSTF